VTRPDFRCWHIASFRCAAEFGHYQGHGGHRASRTNQSRRRTLRTRVDRLRPTIAGFFRLDPGLRCAYPGYSLLTVARVLPGGAPDSQGRKGVIPHSTMAAMHVGS
jgi:hypothetical protein